MTNDLPIPMAHMCSSVILSIQKLRRIQPEPLTSSPENIAQAMRNVAKRDDSIDELYNVPDNVICALFWTILLVESLLIWSVNLVILVWWQVYDKQDFSDFRN